MNKHTNRVLAAALLVSLVGPLTAIAHEGECIAESEALGHISAVQAAIESAEFMSMNPRKSGDFEKDNLLAKALAAKSYVMDHKYSDANSKLDDIVTKVTGLIDSPKDKIDDYDGAIIVESTLDAMYCVADLQ